MANVSHHNPPGSFEQEIDIKELLHVVWKHKLLVLLVTVLTLCGALLYHYSSTPSYQASSTMLIKSSKGGSDFVYPMQSVTGSALQNDIELLRSYTLALEVVQELYAMEDRPALHLFLERRYVSPVDAWLCTHGVKPMDECSESGISAKLAKMPQHVKEGLFAELLRGRIAITNPRETNILKVSVSSPFEHEAVLLTNALCRAYVKKDIDWNTSEASVVKEFVAEQLAGVDGEVSELEGKLSSYMRQENIYELNGNAGNLLSRLIAAESRYNDTQAEINILKKRQAFILQKLSDEERELSKRLARNLDDQARELKGRIRQEEMALIGTGSTQEGEGSGSLAKQRLVTLRGQLDELTRNMLAGEIAFSSTARQLRFDLISEQLRTDVRLAELGYVAEEYLRIKNNYDAELNKLPQKQLNYARLQRDREVLNNNYMFLKQKLEESRIQIASEVGKVMIVDEARGPLGRPESPNFQKNVLIGLILGLGLSGALIVLRQVLDSKVRSEEYIEHHGFRLLAFIPFLKPSIVQKACENLKHPDSKGRKVPGPVLLMSAALPDAFCESFRTLRSSVTLFHAEKQGADGVLMVTGIDIGEGKTTVCANLGLTMALTGKRVLIVDCDLRRSSMQKVFRTDKTPGLSEYLSGTEQDLDRCIQQAGHEHLYVLPAGAIPFNANDLLASSRIKELLKRLRHEWDVVLLDTPPVLMISDAALLSSSVQGIIMVVRLDHSNKRVLADIKSLPYIMDRMLGVVIVGSKRQKHYSKYGNYYSRYGYKGSYA